MKRAWWLVPVVAFLVWWFAPRPKFQSPVTPGAVSTTVATPGRSQELLGEKILRDYGQGDPRNDVAGIAHLMENFTLLVKNHRSLAINEDWAAAFRGQNPARERFLPDHHPALKGDKLVDRWGTPIYIHALGGGRFEVRSAGLDGEMWTADDIQF